MSVKIEHIMFIIVAGFLCGLVLAVILITKPQVSFLSSSEKNPQPTQVDVKSEPLKDKLQRIEDDLQVLSERDDKQASVVADLKTQIDNQSSSQMKLEDGKRILAVTSTQGGLFTTSSQSYSPMGMYVNIKCSVACYLWINFYSSSKNQTQPPGVPGYFNIYNAFIDGGDQNIFSQASFPAAGSAAPVSLNAAFATSAGIHTVDVRAKTTGGILESPASYLQVMAIEQ